MCEIAQSKIECAAPQPLEDPIIDAWWHGLPGNRCTQKSVTQAAAVDSARL
jgi:hypothetical protein